MTAAFTAPQKIVLRGLIRESIANGFDSGYPLGPLAALVGMTVKELYDNETNTGILWELGPYGEGLIYVHHDGSFASVPYDTHQLLAHWVGI